MWRDYLFRILRPRYWMQNEPTNPLYSRALERMIDMNAAITDVGEHTCRIAGVEIWIGNYPYSYGHDYNNNIGLPTARVRKKLKDYLAKHKSNITRHSIASISATRYLQWQANTWNNTQSIYSSYVQYNHVVSVTPEDHVCYCSDCERVWAFPKKEWWGIPHGDRMKPYLTQPTNFITIQAQSSPLCERCEEMLNPSPQPSLPSTFAATSHGEVVFVHRLPMRERNGVTEWVGITSTGRLIWADTWRCDLRPTDKTMVSVDATKALHDHLHHFTSETWGHYLSDILTHHANTGLPSDYTLFLMSLTHFMEKLKKGVEVMEGEVRAWKMGSIL